MAVSIFFIWIENRRGGYSLCLSTAAVVVTIDPLNSNFQLQLRLRLELLLRRMRRIGM
jgi:hypothetical protein